MDGIAWAGSAMVAARTRLEIATQNLANVSTDGFARIAARGALTPTGAVVVGRPSGVQGPLRHTGGDHDLAIVGPGTFAVRAGDGTTATTRAGAFTREPDGTLRDAAGRTLLASDGRPLHVPERSTIDERGYVLVDDVRSGQHLTVPASSSIRSGFLESANVDAIHEMIDVMSAERSFETAQKVVSAIDGTRQKASSDVARVK